MLKFISFLCGTIFGVYLEQHYDLPNVKNVFEQTKALIKKYEKRFIYDIKEKK